MANIKHVGRIATTKRKVIVAYRVVPNDPENCIVVTTENLMADEHDALMKLVESDAGQQANELADAMARARLPDGRIMLAAFHATGKMIKINTSMVEMTPNMQTTISLKELNEMVAQQKGVSVADLAVKPANVNEAPKSAPVAAATPETFEAFASNEQPLSDDALAAKYRSDADRLYKEAKRLREEAEKLSPTKKKSSEPSA